MQRALGDQFLRQAAQQGHIRLGVEKRLQRSPFHGLGILKEAADIFGKKGERFVIGVRTWLLVADGLRVVGQPGGSDKAHRRRLGFHPLFPQPSLAPPHDMDGVN